MRFASHPVLLMTRGRSSGETVTRCRRHRLSIGKPGRIQLEQMKSYEEPLARPLVGGVRTESGLARSHNTTSADEFSSCEAIVMFVERLPMGYMEFDVRSRFEDFDESAGESEVMTG